MSSLTIMRLKILGRRSSSILYFWLTTRTSCLQPVNHSFSIQRRALAPIYTTNRPTMSSTSDEPPRKSPRKRSPVAETAETEPEKRGRPKKQVNEVNAEEAAAKENLGPTTKKKGTRDDKKSNDGDEETKPAVKKQKTADHQRLTERDELPKLWKPEDHPSSYTFKIASWNVAGLRALLKNQPNALQSLVENHDLDVLCLQEIKLQESHLEDPKLGMAQILPNYDAHYSCSTTKKGYSGTAVYIKKRGSDSSKMQATIDSFFYGGNKRKTTGESQKNCFDSQLIPTKVTYGMGIEIHDTEGRIICVEFPFATFINCYVPNSGQTLQRLDYRTEQWDKDLVKFVLQKHQETNKPVVWLGDLNVAHTNLEVWNDGAKHLPKQAGVTPQERSSFTKQLEDSKYVDLFRYFHPTAKGHYSYWSQRAGNREPNKGLRLDYFIGPPDLLQENGAVVARDSYMLFDVFGSDHCPVVLEVEIKKA